MTCSSAWNSCIRSLANWSDIFFVTSSMKLDIAALPTAPGAIAMIPVFLIMMLIARGAPVLWLHRAPLALRAQIALGFHTSTQLPLVVAVTALAVDRELMPGWCAAALASAAVLSVILFPALARVALGSAAPSNQKTERLAE